MNEELEQIATAIERNRGGVAWVEYIGENLPFTMDDLKALVADWRRLYANELSKR